VENEKGTGWREVRTQALKETWDSKYGESMFPCNNLAKKVRFAACLWFAKVSSLRDF